MLQGRWQTAADHLKSRFNQLQQQQQRQHNATEAMATAAGTAYIDAVQQQEQLMQAEHMWDGLQVCSRGITLFAGLEIMPYIIQQILSSSIPWHGGCNSH